MPEAASSRSTLAVLLWGIAGALLSGAMAVLEPNMLEEGLILHLAQRMQDGEHLYRDLIAFTGQDEQRVFQVYVVDTKSKRVRQLTSGTRDSLDPTWSPDGRFLALTSNRDGANVDIEE